MTRPGDEVYHHRTVLRAGRFAGAVRRSKPALAALTLAGFAAFAGAARVPQAGVILIVFGLLCIFFVASAMSRAAGIAHTMQHLEQRRVTITIWGTALDADTIRAVTALSAGLLIYVAAPARGVVLLKIAQPSPARVSHAEVAIEQAAYVSFAGKKLPRVEGVPAVLIRVV